MGANGRFGRGAHPDVPGGELRPSAEAGAPVLPLAAGGAATVAAITGRHWLLRAASPR